MNNRMKGAITSYPWDYIGLIFIAWMIPAFYGLTNRYFIGFMNYESVVVDQSYEALEVAFEVLLEMFPLAVLALVAKNFTNRKRTSEILSTGLIMQLGITLIFIVLVLIFAHNFIDLINTPESSKDLALTYFRVRTLVLPFQTMSLLFIITIKAMRHGKIAVFLAFVGVFINFSLDSIFISNYPFSLKLGLMGSAYGNIAANILLFLISGSVAFYLLRKDLKMTFHIPSLKSIFKIGKWTGTESLVRNLGYIIGVIAVVNFIGSVEEEAIGGYNTAIWVMWAIVLIPVLAWTEATQIAIGNAYGKKDVRTMKDIQVLSTILMGGYMILWVAIGNFAWGPISSWLNQGIEQDVVKYSILTFNFMIWPYILFAIGSGLKTYFIGTGRPAPIFIASAIVNIGIFLPLGLAVKYSWIEISYVAFLIVNIVVFSLDLAIISFALWKYGYSKLDIREEPGGLRVGSRSPDLLTHPSKQLFEPLP